MTDSGALTIAGTSSFTTSANDATIALDTTTNAFTGAVTITTNDNSGTDADVTIRWWYHCTYSCSFYH